MFVGRQAKRCIGRSAFSAGHEDTSLVRAIDELYNGSATPNGKRYVWLLRQCTIRGDVEQGRRLHSHIIRFNWHRQTHLGNLLVEMYGKLGCLQDAEEAFAAISNPDAYSWNILLMQLLHGGHFHKMKQVFESATEKNSISWNLLITAHLRHGLLREAAALFYSPVAIRNTSTWNIMIQAYAQNGHPHLAFELFSEMMNRDVISWTTIMAMHARNGEVECVLQMFRMIPERNFVPWNVVISAFAQLGEIHSCLELFLEMPQRSIVSWNTLLQAFVDKGELDMATKVFYMMPQRDSFSWNAAVSGFARSGQMFLAQKMAEEMPCEKSVAYNMMVSAYAQAGHLSEAREMFDEVPTKNFVSWNTMIHAYAHAGAICEMKELFDRASQRDILTWSFVIGAFAGCFKEDCATEVFLKMPCHDTFAWNMMMQACTLVSTKSGTVEKAEKLFERMPQRDIVSWTALITIYGQHNRISDAKLVFDKIPSLSEVSCNAMLSAYSHSGQTSDSWTLFQSMRRRDVLSWTILSTTYSESPELAKLIFDKAPLWSVLSWNSILHAFLQGGELQDGVSFFRTMPEQNSYTNNMMITAYSQYGLMEDAKKIFDEMPDRTVVSWNAMIQAYALNNDANSALALYAVMDQEGQKPDETTFVNVLEACSICLDHSHGVIVHENILDSGVPFSSVLISSLVNFYGQCGRLEEAKGAFTGSSTGLSGWNALLAAYARQGHASKIAELFKLMKLEGLELDSVAFFGVLTACSYVGFHATDVFIQMVGDYGMVAGPEHYKCVVEAFARLGELGSAEELVKNMPFYPDIISWNMLLNASGVQTDLEFGLHAGRKLLQLEPGCSSTYVMMSNLLHT